MWTEIAQVIDFIGAYPFRAAVRSESDGDVAVVQLADASPVLSQDLGRTVPLLRNHEGKFDRYLLKRGDVLVQARGFRNPAGLVTIDFPAIAAPGLHALRPLPEHVLPEYLHWCLNHPKIQSAFAEVAQGSHAPFISKQTLMKVQIPVPRLAVQRDIVHVDQLRRTERQLAEQLAAAQDELANEKTWRAAMVP
jgi:hypothetical protein